VIGIGPLKGQNADSKPATLVAWSWRCGVTCALRRSTPRSVCSVVVSACPCSTLELSVYPASSTTNTFPDARIAVHHQCAERGPAIGDGQCVALHHRRPGRTVGTWQRRLARDAVLIRAAMFDRLTSAEDGAVRAAIQKYGNFLGMTVRLASRSSLGAGRDMKRPDGGTS